MKIVKLVKPVVAAVLVLGPAAAFACGELKFNAGKGLPFQTYLTPRPANVLILSSGNEAEQGALYGGLEKAGHKITVVPDVNALNGALEQQRYDIVIAALESADAVSATVASNADSLTRLLPVVARSVRNSPQVRERFEQFVLDGASLGQYLTTINRLLPRAR